MADFSRKKTALICCCAIGVAALLTLAGCGGNEQPASTGVQLGAPNVDRSTPGTVEMLDSLHDISGSDPNLSTAPSFLDISRASVSKDGNNLKFTMELGSALPEGPQPGTVAEWGFLLDADSDGAPDWGIFADLSAKDGWLPGIYNQQTKLRQAGAQFAGSFSHSGTTILLTVDAAALGSPQTFKWFAYTDAGLSVAEGKTVKAGDKIWEPAVPNNSADWLPFP